MSDTSNLDLMRLTAEALHERAANILELAEHISVRVEVNGNWQSLYLAEMPATVAIREAFRLLLRAEVPHRSVRGAKDAG